MAATKTRRSGRDSSTRLTCTSRRARSIARRATTTRGSSRGRWGSSPTETPGSSGRTDGGGAGACGGAGERRRLPAASETTRVHLGRAAPAHIQSAHLRVFLHGTHSAATSAPRQRDGEPCLDDGVRGKQGAFRLSATKGAIHAYTESLAQNLVERHIRVNCVAPGPIWTPLDVVDEPPEEAAKHGASAPMQRPGQP